MAGCDMARFGMARFGMARCDMAQRDMAADRGPKQDICRWCSYPYEDRPHGRVGRTATGLAPPTVGEAGQHIADHRWRGRLRGVCTGCRAWGKNGSVFTSSRYIQAVPCLRCKMHSHS